MRHSMIPLFLIVFIDALGLSIVLPIYAPIFLHNLGNLFSEDTSFKLREFLFNFIIFLYPLCMFLVAPLLGGFSDRYGRKRILVLAMLGEFIGFIVSAISILVSSLTLLFLGRIISGLTAGTIPIANAAVVDISEEGRRANNIGLMSFANNMGFVLGPIVGGLFAAQTFLAKFGTAPSFCLVALLALITVFLAIFMFKETNVTQQVQPMSFLAGVKNIGTAFTQAEMRSFSISFLLFTIAYLMFYWYLPVFLTVIYNLSTLQISWFLSNYGFWFAFASLVLIRVLNKYLSAKKIYFYALVELFVVGIIFLINRNEAFAWILATFMAIGSSLGIISAFTIFAGLADAKSQGKIMGIAGSLLALGWALGPLLAGILSELNILLPYVLMILLLFLAGLKQVGK